MATTEISYFSDMNYGGFGVKKRTSFVALELKVGAVAARQRDLPAS